MGSWNGQVIFDEPMVTRAFILAQRSGPATAGTIAVPAARRYAPAGFYPVSYGIRWDEGRGGIPHRARGPQLARLSRFILYLHLRLHVPVNDPSGVGPFDSPDGVRH